MTQHEAQRSFMVRGRWRSGATRTFIDGWGGGASHRHMPLLHRAQGPSTEPVRRSGRTILVSNSSSARPSLRPYQREAIAAVLAARRSGVQRMLVCLPTGAGKTVIFSELAQLARRQVLVLAHREELLAQAQEKLQRALQGAHVVAIERGAERAPADAKVLVCSLRSLHEERLA